MVPTSQERKLTNLQKAHDRIVSRLRVTENKIIHLAHYAGRLNRRLQSPLTYEEKDCIKAKLVHLSNRLAKFGANVKRLSAQTDVLLLIQIDVLLLVQTDVLLLAQCGADTQ